MDESRGGNTQIQIGLFRWSEHHRNHSVGHSAPEFLSDVIRTRLRFEGQIEHGQMRVIRLTSIVLLTLLFDTTAERFDWIVLFQSVVEVQPRF